MFHLGDAYAQIGSGELKLFGRRSFFGTQTCESKAFKNALLDVAVERVHAVRVAVCNGPGYTARRSW